MIQTFDDLFGLWDSIADMAKDVGVPAERAQKWRQRRRIAVDHWPAVRLAVEGKGHELSADQLLGMHTRAQRRASSSARAGR